METSTAGGVVRRDARDELVAIGRWALLGTAAGALAGAVVGGVGGRVAMLVLRVTSSDAVRGVQSDDGFTIGRFSLDTSFLLLLNAVLGAANGLVYVSCRSFLPERLRVPGWTVIGGLVGGSLIVQPDGVDFNLLDPLRLAVTLFTIIPAVGAGLTALLVERWAADWWWRDRRRTAIAMLPAAAACLVVPLVLVALGGVLLVFLVGRSWTVRKLAGSKGAKLAATVVLAVVVALGGVALLTDIREVLS